MKIFGVYNGWNGIEVHECEARETDKMWVVEKRLAGFGRVLKIPKAKAFLSREDALAAFIQLYHNEIKGAELRLNSMKLKLAQAQSMLTPIKLE